MPRKRRIRLIVAAVVVPLLAGSLVARTLRPVDVVVTPVVRGHVVDAVYATGTVEAQRRVTVKARTAGPVVELTAADGEAVHFGQRLARIDNPAAAFDLERSRVEARAADAQSSKDAPQLASLEAQIAELTAQLEAARREADRAERLFKSGASGQADWERARDHVAELQARLAARKAQARAQRIDLDANRGRTQAVVRSLATRVSDSEVRAPLDGVVLAHYVEPGEVVAVNQALFKVGDTRELRLEVNIDESDVSRVHDGTRGHAASAVAASLPAFPGRVFRGHVVQVMPDADRDKKTYLAKIQLDEPVAALRSGMTAEVNIVVEDHGGALLAPADAIADGEVWVVRDGRAERRKVDVGIRDLTRAEVRAGLSEGDQVVVAGQDKIARGKRVRSTVQTPDLLDKPKEGTLARSGS